MSELKQQTFNQRTITFSKYGFDSKKVDSEAELKALAQDMVDTSYIYYMDEEGDVFDKDANFLTKVDLTPKTNVSDDDFGILGYNNPRINGDSTGAFIRQTSVQGYIGSRTSFTLPSNTSGGFDIPVSSNVGYIYNGLDYNVETGSNSFSMEGGLQVSQANNNYSAYIRVNGGALNFTDDTGGISPRFKAGTSFVSNLRYEVSTNKVKYYASGTNINNVAQNISFTYAKSFTSSELAAMRAKRVLSIASSSTYDGTQNLGYIAVNYTGASLLKTDGATAVNYNTSLLDTVLYNNKIYGTAYWPSNKVTYSPTSGDVSTQSQKVDTRS